MGTSEADPTAEVEGATEEASALGQRETEECKRSSKSAEIGRELAPGASALVASAASA